MCCFVQLFCNWRLKSILAFHHSLKLEIARRRLSNARIIAPKSVLRVSSWNILFAFDLVSVKFVSNFTQPLFFVCIRTIVKFFILWDIVRSRLLARLFSYYFGIVKRDAVTRIFSLLDSVVPGKSFISSDVCFLLFVRTPVVFVNRVKTLVLLNQSYPSLWHYLAIRAVSILQVGRRVKYVARSVMIRAFKGVDVFVVS